MGMSNLAFIKWAAGIKKAAKKVLSQDGWTAADYWDQSWKKTPEKVFLVFADDGRQYTYAEANAEANRIANWALSIGVQKGDTVSLMKDNCPEFILIWLGLAKIGASTALINFNLKETPLANCLKLAATASASDGPKVVIYGSECMEKVVSVAGHEALQGLGEYRFFEYCPGGEKHTKIENKEGQQWSFLEEELEQHSTDEPDRELRAGRKYDDVLFFVYTSGTTGLPKAANFNHLRFYGGGEAFSSALKLKSKDVVYCPLPVYHSAGGALGISICLSRNMTFVLRKKFSASKYFEDCFNYRCTVGQYIGELCRYLLAAPPSEYDTKHHLRILIGNGVRKDIWLQCQERFKIKQFGEFYASTEGNANMINTANVAGAVGYIPWPVYKLYPVEIIKMDPEDEETPLRNKKGRCIKCKPGEVGQLIGLIKMNDPTRRFDGYTDKKASKKKVLENVFKQGDQYFATGDLMMRENNLMYFIDRIGDTFRWKGENCSTREVEDAVKIATTGIAEVNVYGVQVADVSGRAGMASIQLESEASVDSFEFSEFFANAAKQLASYQIPLFLRFQERFDETSTFKLKKTDLR